MKKSGTSGNWPRYILQWGVLAALVAFITGLLPSKDAIDVEAYCPVGGLEALATYGVRGSLPCSMSSLQILMGIALAAAVVLFGKLFCGYLCPLGTVQDLMIKLRCKLKIKNISIVNGSVADKVLRFLKYAILFYIFYATTSASELICKQLDPYYAMATGFKGEIVLWMSITTVTLLFAGGLLVDMFWCRYMCPLGALSNTLKYWVWVLVVAAAWLGLVALGVNIPWWCQFALVCAGGYVLELFRKPKLQVLNIRKDDEKCIACGKCDKACPFHIQIAEAKPGSVPHVDCTLCGECVASCPTGALGVRPAGKGKKSGPTLISSILPAILTVVLAALGIWIGGKVELPTINETWGLESVDSLGNVTVLVDKDALQTVKLDGLRSVKCFSSSMAFKAKLEKIRGVHGVKTYVSSHTANVLYDPAVISPEKIQEDIFSPSVFRVNSLDPQALDSLKIYTVRTEKMNDKVDINYFGLQLRNTGRKIYGVETEFACPLIVKVYVDPEEEFESDWFKEIVSLKSLEMPVHGGGVKTTPVDWKFVRLEKEVSYIDTPAYLHRMFSPFKAQFKSRVEEFEGQPQKMLEIVDQNYEKPIILRNMPFLSNHLSRHDGLIGVYLDLNADLKPAIMIRYASPLTAEKVWELMTMDTWTITYKADDVREESAKLSFKTPGIEHDFDPEVYGFCK